MWNDKPDGCPIPARNPTGMDTGMNFYPQVWVWVQISTRSLFAGGRIIALPEPDPLPSLHFTIAHEPSNYSTHGRDLFLALMVEILKRTYQVRKMGVLKRCNDNLPMFEFELFTK
jgi:hypothetical protein